MTNFGTATLSATTRTVRPAGCSAIVYLLAPVTCLQQPNTHIYTFISIAYNHPIALRGYIFFVDFKLQMLISHLYIGNTVKAVQPITYIGGWWQTLEQQHYRLYIAIYLDIVQWDNKVSFTVKSCQRYAVLKVDPRLSASANFRNEPSASDRGSQEFLRINGRKRPVSAHHCHTVRPAGCSAIVCWRRWPACSSLIHIYEQRYYGWVFPLDFPTKRGSLRPLRSHRWILETFFAKKCHR